MAAIGYPPGVSPDETRLPDDAALVARCRAGDGAAWRELVQRYQRLVFAVVRRAGLDEATGADVFQTVFVRLLDHLPRLQQPERLQAWIVTTAKREALRQRERAMRTRSIDADEGTQAEAQALADPGPLADEALAELQQLHLLRQALGQLDERCRRLLEALFADEPPAYADLSARLGLPVGSIGPTRGRCLQRLRQLIEALS